MIKSRKYPVFAAFFLPVLLFLSSPAIHAQDADAAQNHYAKATELKEQGDAEGALNELKLAVKSDPGNAAYRFDLGVSYLERESLDEAVSELEAALKIDAGNVDAYKYLGIACSKLGNYQKSLDAFMKAIEIAPGDAVLHNDAGQTSYMMKKLDEAESHLAKAIELDPKLAVAYVNLVNVYVEKGNFGKAVEIGEKAIALDPEDSVARNNLSYAYYKQGNFVQAYEQMKKSVELQPGNSNLMSNLKFLEEKAAQQKKDAEMGTAGTEGEKAEKFPREITLQEVHEKMRHEPEETKPSQAGTEAKEPETAPVETVIAKPPEAPGETAGKATESEPVSAPATAEAKQPRPLKTEERAVEKPKPVATEEPVVEKPEPVATEVPAEKTPEAAASAPKALKEEAPAKEKAAALAAAPPAKEEKAAAEKESASESGGFFKEKPARPEKETRSTGWHYRKALTKTKIQKYESAESYLGKALAAEPDNPDFQTLSAIINDLLGFNQSAMVALDKTIEQNPGHSNAHNARGHVNYALGRLDEAAADYEKAYSLDPSNACAAANHGSLRLFDGDAETGQTLLRTALELGCRDAGTLSNLALARYLDGDDYGAVTLIRESVYEAPENAVIKENAAFIKGRSPSEFKPITIALVHPKPFPPPSLDKPTTLDSLVPVEPIRFYDFFQRRYQTKTVAILPFAGQAGYRGEGESPAEQMTRELTETLKTNKHFKVASVEGIEELAMLEDQPNLLIEQLKKRKVDIVISAAPGRFTLEDRTQKKLYGLKKKKMVAGAYPFQLRILETGTGRPVFEGEVSGEAIIDNRVSYEVSVKEKRDLKMRAFANFCEEVSRTLNDQYNLVPFDEPRGMVRYRVVRPEGYTKQRYP